MAGPLNSSTVIVDDADPALVYSGNWISGGSTNEFGGTTHGSRTSGSSVQFIFHGTSVAVYGTFGVDTSRSSYRLDNSDPILFSVGPRTTPLYQQLFFKSPTLTDGEHTLVITDVGIGAFWIDYILYVPSVPQPISSSTTTPPPPTPTTPTPTPPTPTPFTSTTTTTPKPVNNTPTPKPPSTTSQTDSGPDPPGQTNSNAPSGKSSIPPAAVAGGAIGALVLIIALVFAMLYYRKRARRLAGAKLLEKEGVLDDPPELGRSEPGALIIPFTSAYNPAPHIHPGNGNSGMNMYPPGPAYQPSDHNYPNQSHPSTPVYQFSNHPALRSGYNASSDYIVAADPGYGNGGSQYELADPTGDSSYLPNPHSQYGGVQQQDYTSSDALAVPQRQGSLESAESHTSLAYLSNDRVAVDPPLPLPDTLPGPPSAQAQPLYQPPAQATPQRTGKGSFMVRNDSTPELRQHEDGGVRLDVQQPQGPRSQQEQVIDLPPAYKPNY